MILHVWLMSAVMIMRLVDCHQPSPTPTHISSINSLREKMLSPTLDPKLRRALLRVLSKLEKGTLPIDPDTELSDEDFLKIFGQSPAPSEDLGSIESKEVPDEKRPFIPTKTPEQVFAENKANEEKFNGQLFTYIPPQLETNKKSNSQENSGEGYPNYGYSYIPPPVTETSKQPENNQPENKPTKPTPEQNNEVYFQVPTPIDIPDQVEEMTPDKDSGHGQREEDSNNPSNEEDFSEVDIDERVQDNNNSTEVEVSESITREIKESNRTVGNGTDKVYKHEVEFLPSSLVAAFTVQQDDKGIPRKIIPLDDIHQQKVLVEKKQKELLEKEFRLQQQLRSLQEEKYRFQGALENEGLLPKARFPALSAAIIPSTNIYSETLGQQELKNTGTQRLLGEQQEFQRLRDLERERQEDYRRQQEYQRQELFRQQEAKRLQDISRQQELQRQRDVPAINRPFTPSLAFFPPNQTPYNAYQTKYNNYNQFQKPQQQQQQQQDIDFQKSVDYRIPTTSGFLTSQQSFNTFGPLSNYQHLPNVELNRVNRKEPQQFIGNFGFRPPVDYQLQNLIAQSGLSTFLPSDNRDDLNIVSKVLSLNHGGFPKDNLSKSSELISTFINPPSNVIQPPLIN